MSSNVKTASTLWQVVRLYPNALQLAQLEWTAQYCDWLWNHLQKIEVDRDRELTRQQQTGVISKIVPERLPYIVDLYRDFPQLHNAEPSILNSTYEDFILVNTGFYINGKGTPPARPDNLEVRGYRFHRTYVSFTHPFIELGSIGRVDCGAFVPELHGPASDVYLIKEGVQWNVALRIEVTQSVARDNPANPQSTEMKLLASARAFMHAAFPAQGSNNVKG